ncbi:hypothetical protein Cgig2_022362 [Carnegiea gigantea]|uniref:Uncharacterized protein n=1 Tax=Carnegiea gigantea TaxID=171969 RepID=A0A9Q1KGK4_9CARY|nr:hypothetical protein Cgig2_022362 [Carnegiea gigantea]
MAGCTHGPPAQPTLGWVENAVFHCLPNLFLQSLMDCPVRSWDNFSPVDRKRLRRLKCMLPSGRLVPGQVSIVKEFDANWPPEWRASVWADGRRCIRVEHMVEDEGIVQVFDIDPTPAPTYIPQSTYMISADVTNVHYGGWTDNTYLFVLHPGRDAAKFDINFTPLEALNGIMYDIHTMTMTSPDGMPQGVPIAITEDVRVFVWNCRGTGHGVSNQLRRYVLARPPQPVHYAKGLLSVLS